MEIGKESKWKVEGKFAQALKKYREKEIEQKIPNPVEFELLQGKTMPQMIRQKLRNRKSAQQHRLKLAR